MKACSLRLCAAILLPCLILGMASATADEPAVEKQKASDNRPIFTHDRPESVRGWVTVSKSVYWSLCYESLDRMQEARKLIGQGKDDELADALDKCGCWLDMSASAAMTDGRSGIVGASELFEDAAEAIRDGSSQWTDTQLNDLVTLGLVCMAKSHVLRAGEADERFRAERRSANTTVAKTAVTDEVDKEIREEKISAGIAQYLYDARQSWRHLQVAQVYFRTAADDGGFQLNEELTAQIPEVAPDLKAFELVDYVEVEIRPRIKAMLAAVEGRRMELRKKLPE